MTRPRTTDIVDRRQFCRTTAAAGVALSVFGLPDLGRAQSVQPPQQSVPPPKKPSTNGQDALAYPRTGASLPGKYPSRVAQATHEKSVVNNAPDPAAVEKMITHALLSLTGASSITAAWREFVAPEDIVGLKVNPVAGALLSTSPEVVSVVIRQLIQSGVPKEHIVIWDRREFELADAGFTQERFPGIRLIGTERKDAAGSFTDAEGKLLSEAMIDRAWFYWADVEEKYDAETLPYMVNEGKHSYFTRIVTQDVTKIINLPILKNAGASVTLCLKNLAYGAITNTGRLHKQLWAETCAEVPAFPPLRDKVVLNIVDGIKGCYNGGPGANPQFFTNYNTILAGTDPVAVDRIGYEIVLKKRLEEKVQKEESPRGRGFLTLAEQMGLGTADLGKITLDHERLT
jgi:uncharacterized protein (DUF362 family)